jgi:porin
MFSKTIFLSLLLQKKFLSLFSIITFFLICGYFFEVKAEDSLVFEENLTEVTQLSDIKVTDWAFVALQNLIAEYGGPIGYPDKTFRGDSPLSRYEFATALKFFLEKIDRSKIKSTDFPILNKLEVEFSLELATLRGRVDGVEARILELEETNFSTTTKLSGQGIFAVSGGTFNSDRLIAPRGAQIAQEDPNISVVYRLSLDLNTSFNGKDLLKVRLVSASTGINDHAAGLLEPNFGSTLEFSLPGRKDRVTIARMYYSFSQGRDLRITIGPTIVAHDFMDLNRYANISFLDFSTQALIINYILIPRPVGTGTIIDWRPNGGDWRLKAMYLSGDANNQLPENQQALGGGQIKDIRLFPVAGGGAKGGLFNDPHQGLLELQYLRDDNLDVKFQYGLGKIFGSNYQVFGVNFSYALTPKIGIFGRYAYGSYDNTTVGNIHPQSWSGGISVRDLGVERAIAGMAIGQPFVESSVGNTTQTNLEVFYNFPVGDRIRITPLMQVILNPGNQDSNGTIFSGTLRTVFSF